MKGKRAIFLSAVLVCSLGAGSLFAQESDDPVLQKARDKYQEQLDKGHCCPVNFKILENLAG